MRSVNAVTIGAPERGQVEIADPRDPFPDSDPGRFTDFRLLLRAPRLDATALVRNHHGSDGLSAFLRELADGWRGWSGAKRWEAVEHQMAIYAEHDGRGHVALHVTARDSYRHDAWSASVHVEMDAGEDLRAFADDVTALILPASSDRS